jgi:membrane fusion protein, macrolide-specific efflux system
MTQDMPGDARAPESGVNAETADTTPVADATAEFAIDRTRTGPPPAHRWKPGRWRRRWWLIGAGALVVVVAIGVTVGVASGSSTPAPRYRTVVASTGTMRLTTSAAGTLQSAQLANLSFQASGQVTTVSVRLGQHVAAGQKLATVSSAALASQVAQAQAGVDGDQAKLTSDESAGASGAQLDADRAALTAAQAGLANSRAALSQATLVSPIAGTVAQLDLTVGQQISAGGASSSASGSSTGASGSTGSANGAGGGFAASSSNGSSSSGSGTTTSGTASASAQIVVTGSAYVVDLSVDDTQISLMKDGEQAVVIPQGSTTPVYGTVTSVGLLASSTSGVASFPVIVTVTGTPKGLFVGSSASVSVIYRQLADVLEVPAAAIHYSAGKATVLQSRSGKTVSVPVGAGLTSGGVTQITSGLSAGQQVLVAQSTSPSAGAGGSTRSGTGTGGGFGGGSGFGGGGGGFGGGSGFGGGGTRSGSAG